MSKEARTMQQRITELENKGFRRTQRETTELRRLVTNFPSNTDFDIKDETLKEIYR